MRDGTFLHSFFILDILIIHILNLCKIISLKLNDIDTGIKIIRNAEFHYVSRCFALAISQNVAKFSCGSRSRSARA